MFNPVPGGSTMRVGFDEEFIDVHLPPVGYVVDKMPDPKTGKPSEKIIRSEILFDDLPLVDKNWRKPQLPENWDKWLEEERMAKLTNPNYSHPDLDYFRAQEWRRRINGVWIAIGNRKKKPVEYVYLTGFAYFYLGWWDLGFKMNFRFVLLKIFYMLQYAEEDPTSFGVVLSTLRRLGKTSIAYCWLFELTSRCKFMFGGSQAQKFSDAKEFFILNIAGPFTRLPEFFRPIYDQSGELKSGLFFRQSIGKGKNAKKNFAKSEALNSHITFKETKGGAYDKAKLHRYIVEEPGKWDEADVYDTVNKVKPALTDGPQIIGKGFLPTTIEELELGGDSFIKLAEDSMPSQRKNHGTTTSGFLFLFIPAYEGYLFDEYGRSVIDDPADDEEVYDDLKGERIKEGAKTILLRRRKRVEHDIVLLTSEMRKYPWTWEEAKSMANEFCHFNHMELTKQLQYLQGLKTPLWRKGNLSWVKEKDGDVEWKRDDHTGRFKIHWLPDETGPGGEFQKGNKILNNVGEGWDEDRNKKMFFPKNDHLFAIGCDPIRNTKTDDPTASKAATYVFRKYDAAVDHGKPKEQWLSYKFIIEYLTRPEDPEVFHEDMIMLCRFFSCSILPEDNVETLRQHFDSRGYGRFVLYRGNFNSENLPGVKTEGEYANKGLRSDPEVINNYVDGLKMYYNRHIGKVVFENLIEQSLKFRIAKHFMQDAVVGAGYTLLAAKAEIIPPEEEDSNTVPLELSVNPMYDQSGSHSSEVEINELIYGEEFN